MLFKDISLLDENMQIKEHCYLGVKDGKIAYLADLPPAEDYGEVYNGAGRLATPAFYNTHSHLPMSLLRGYGENLSLQDWLNQRIFPFEAHLTEQDIYYGTLLGIAEMLRFGIVASTDMYFCGEAIVAAFAQSGAKGNISIGTTCFDDRSFYQLPQCDETKRLFAAYHGSEDGRLRIDASLHGEYTSTPKVAETIGRFAADLGCALHIHLSETKQEHEECKARHGLTPTAYFASLGMLDVPVNAAHCVWLEGEDFAILKDKGVNIASCPKSNLKLASGVCNAKKIMDMGVSFSLATDSVSSNNNLNMLEEIRTFALVQKGFNYDPLLITPPQAFYLAMRAGALAQGRGDCGLLKQGYRADIVIWDLSGAYHYPCHDLLNNMLYAACGSDVVLTMADGCVLYRDGQYKTIDIEKVTWQVGRSCERILQQLAKEAKNA